MEITDQDRVQYDSLARDIRCAWLAHISVVKFITAAKSRDEPLTDYWIYAAKHIVTDRVEILNAEQRAGRAGRAKQPARTD